MKYVRFEHGTREIVTALGCASRCSKGYVQIYEPGGAGAASWTLDPGPEADAAWAAVCAVVEDQAAQIHTCPHGFVGSSCGLCMRR